jgi:hypothetical protein
LDHSKTFFRLKFVLIFDKEVFFFPLKKVGGSMQELDDAGTYYDLGARQVTSAGVVHYMCTRNNNFSNRDQKGELVSSENQFVDGYVGAMGATLNLP